MERLITDLSWILEVEKVMTVLKVLGILEVVVEAQKMRCLSFLILSFLYCRNVSLYY